MAEPKKIRITCQKTEAYNLKPGELWVALEQGNGPAYWEVEVDRFELGIPILVRTNVPVEQSEDGDLMVYRLTINYQDGSEKDSGTEMDPHYPPGMTRP